MTMHKKFASTVLFVLVSLFSQAGRIDTAYVEKFKSALSIKTFILNNGLYYTITPQNNNLFTEQQLTNARTIYNTSVPPVTGVALNIGGVGLTYIFKFTNDTDTAGAIKSGYKQFQLNMYGSRLGMEIAYQDYTRLYFHFKGDDKLVKNYNPDIRVYQFGVNGLFIRNGKRFSYNAAFNQNQFQKKSAGSAITLIGIKYNEVSSNDLIPDSVKGYFEYPNLSSNKNYAFVFQQGYAYNLVKNSFYFANALFVGVGFQNQQYYYGSDKQRKLGVPVSAKGKSSLGYNGKIFFGGIYANADYYQSSIKSLKTEQFQYTYGVFLGVRIIDRTKEKQRAEALKKKEAKREASIKAKEEKKQRKKNK